MKARHRLLAMLTSVTALSLGACSGGDASGSTERTAQDGSEPIELGDRSERASYRVPGPQELARWAVYPIDRVDLERDGGRLEIRYDFPRWLNGVGADVVLEGAYASDTTSFDVTALDLGSGTCTRAGARFECSEILPGISVDRNEAKERMLESNLPSAEIEQRLLVTDRFASDPIGVLEFELEDPD